MPRVMMRQDLARDGYTVPAFDRIEAPDKGIGNTMLSAKDLEGAKQLADLCEDGEPEFWFNRIKLKDGRVFFMYGVDLDWL